jgi:hypothetical protein
MIGRRNPGLVFDWLPDIVPVFGGTLNSSGKGAEI